MRLVVRHQAARQVASIHAYIARSNPAAADRLAEAIYARVARIAAIGFGNMGSPGRVPGTRHVVEGRYVIVYRHDDVRDEIVILSVIHGARRR